MAEIKLYKSMAKGFKLIAMSLPFVFIGYWMISKEQPGTFNYIMGWFCALFFGLGIPIGLFSVFDKRPQIIINETGIWDRTLKQDEIKWEEITEAYPIEISRQKFISLVLTDAFEIKKQYQWAGKFNEYIGAQKLNLNLSQIKTDENRLTLLINKLSVTEKSERNALIAAYKPS